MQDLDRRVSFSAFRKSNLMNGGTNNSNNNRNSSRSSVAAAVNPVYGGAMTMPNVTM